MEFEMAFLVIFVLFTYCLIFYVVFLNANIRRRRDVRFYNSVLSIHKQCYGPQDSLEQLTLNYNKIIQKPGVTNSLSILDMLEQFVYYYDSYSDNSFKHRFGTAKDPQVREFLLVICRLIKEKHPFSFVTSKESDLLKNVNDAIIKNNIDMGLSALQQLADEIANKEKTLKKKEKENQLTTIVSIVGIVLTIFFGILSI